MTFAHRFSSGFGYRSSSLLSLYDFAHTLPYSIFQLMQASITRCVRTELSKGCNIPFSEYVHQEPGWPNRNTLTDRFAEAERRLADVLGYHVGPTCIENEEHTLKNWGQSIRLNWDKIIAVGKCSLNRLDEGISRSRHFIDYREDEPQPGTEHTYNEVVRFIFRDICFDDTDDCCPENLYIFESGLGPKDCYDDDTMGHRIRPFNATYDASECTLIIDIPTVMAVRWDAYGFFNSDTGKLEKVDLCDPNNIVKDIEIYQRTLEQPAGHAVLRPRCQVCCGSGSCKVCQLEKIDICLEKVDNVSGFFKVKPIINTALTDGGEVDECNPCYVPASWNECCEKGYFQRSCLQQPMQVCVSYIAGCGCNCYITDPGGCEVQSIPDEPCDKFKRAIALMAISASPTVCSCGCLSKLYEEWQQDLREVSTNQRFIFRENVSEFILGTRKGEVRAFELIRNLRDFRVQVALI